MKIGGVIDRIVNEGVRAMRIGGAIDHTVNEGGARE
jgi:hypothetical protein